MDDAKQKVFSRVTKALAALLTACILLGIGFVIGTALYIPKPLVKQTIPTTQKTILPITPTLAVYNGWEQYSTNTFILRYPTDWSIIESLFNTNQAPAYPNCQDTNFEISNNTSGVSVLGDFNLDQCTPIDGTGLFHVMRTQNTIIADTTYTKTYGYSCDTPNGGPEDCSRKSYMIMYLSADQTYTGTIETNYDTKINGKTSLLEIIPSIKNQNVDFFDQKDFSNIENRIDLITQSISFR